MSIFLQGLMLGLAIIMPIGPQNAFVMMQGIRKQYYLMTALLCTISDIILLAVGIFAGSVLFNLSPEILKIMTWAGVAFLLWYGFGAFKSAKNAWHSRVTDGLLEMPHYSRRQIIITLLAVTWLNPHVYLDTVVIFGSLASHFVGVNKVIFAIGAMSASFIWFFGLALLAAKFASFLQKPWSQVIINSLVGLIMWVIAMQLLIYAIK